MANVFFTISNCAEAFTLLDVDVDRRAFPLIEPFRTFKLRFGVMVTESGFDGSPRFNSITSLLLKVWSDWLLNANVPVTLMRLRLGIVVPASTNYPFSGTIVIVGVGLLGST